MQIRMEESNWKKRSSKKHWGDEGLSANSGGKDHLAVDDESNYLMWWAELVCLIWGILQIVSGGSERG